MEQREIVVDVENSPLSQSVQHETSPLSESMQHEASPLSSQSQQHETCLLAQSMKQTLDELWGKPKEAENFTIFRVPCKIRENKKDLFEPFVVSIGPFYHGNASLRAMEEKKWRFLRDFLSRGDHLSLDLCISEMKQLEERARRCYSETVDLDSDGFVKMMLLDGCFMIEFFSKWYEGRSDLNKEVGWNWTFILSDLLLLENQIPFFIIQKLCEIGLAHEDTMNFYIYLVGIIMAKGPTNNSLNPDPPAAIHHLVHLCYHCLVPNPEKPVLLHSKSFDLYRMLRMLNPIRIKDWLLGFLLWLLTKRYPIARSRSLSSLALPDAVRNRSVVVIPCATELQDAGIKFKPKSTPHHMLDISFNNGVMEIPRLTIGDDFKPILINLVAFEQSMSGEMSTDHMTSFATFLDSLVNTQRDVMILQQCGIIENCLSGEEELTQFFNQVCEGALYSEDHFFSDLFAEVNRYYESSWNRHRAKLIRDYFSSPWAAISLVAALILLVLTCVQSFFAVYAYYVPSK